MSVHKLASLPAVLLLAACASSPTAPADASKAAARTDPNCLRETGTRVPPKPGHCVIASGRSYTREDLDRTGAATLGAALRRLHPR